MGEWNVKIFRKYINKDKKRKVIGMRVIKTVIAVYICFLIGSFRSSLPFYSAIAAILSMQTEPKESLAVGKNRMRGTIIGGVYGFIVLTLINLLGIESFGHTYYLILSLFLIPIIYTNVNIKTYSSTYISCVVFLSITAVQGRDITPIYFTLNRVTDTLIGIGVSWIVNIIL